MSYIVIIPARYGSTRLPGKPLLPIAGKPMVQHVFENAIKSGAERVIIATEDARIVAAVESFGGEVCLTSPTHPSGTDRIAEVIEKKAIPQDTIIVNLQGDEPCMPAAYIQKVAKICELSQTIVGTLAVPIQSWEEVFNPTLVKVVLSKNYQALYFSRAPIPWLREQQHPPAWNSLPFYRHLGIYAYRAGLVLDFVKLPQSPLETCESLEQLRILWHGGTIQVALVDTATHGIDTKEDLEHFNQSTNSVLHHN